MSGAALQLQLSQGAAYKRSKHSLLIWEGCQIYTAPARGARTRRAAARKADLRRKEKKRFGNAVTKEVARGRRMDCGKLARASLHLLNAAAPPVPRAQGYLAARSRRPASGAQPGSAAAGPPLLLAQLRR